MPPTASSASATPTTAGGAAGIGSNTPTFSSSSSQQQQQTTNITQLLSSQTVDDEDYLGAEAAQAAYEKAMKIDKVPLVAEAWMLLRNEKKFLGGKRLRPRYMVVENGVLRDYDSPAAYHHGQRPKNEFVLQDCRIETVRRKTHTHIIFSTPSRQVDLLPGSSSDAVKWRRILQVASVFYIQEKFKRVQACIRRLLPMTIFKIMRRRVVLVQSLVRRQQQRKPYIDPLKGKRRLAKILLEIRSTERTYVGTLALLTSMSDGIRKEIVGKMKEKEREKETHLAQLLDSTQQLYEIHRTFLYHLDEAMSRKHHNTKSLLPSSFFPVFAQEDVYKSFINAHDKATTMIRKKAPRGSNLAEKLGFDGNSPNTNTNTTNTNTSTAAANSNNNSGNTTPVVNAATALAMANAKKLDIESLLIQPIQRMPRYALMLDEMVKALPESEPCRVQYSELSALCKRTTKSVNESNRWACAQAKVQEVMSTIGDLDPAVVKALKSPQQTFVREAVMSMQFGHHHPQERHLFLFSNVLLICKQPKFSMFATNYEFKRAVWLPMSTITVEKGSGGQPTLKIKTASETHILHPQDQQEASEWQRGLQSCLEGLDSIPDAFLPEPLAAEQIQPPPAAIIPPPLSSPLLSRSNDLVSNTATIDLLSDATTVLGSGGETTATTTDSKSAEGAAKEAEDTSAAPAPAISEENILISFT